jgi:hypothetical protein
MAGPARWNDTLRVVLVDETVRQGFFEPDPNSGERQSFRLRWLPEKPLSDQELRHAEFVRYLIASGRLNESSEQREKR